MDQRSNFYGRRRTHKLRDARRAAFNRVMPAIKLNTEALDANLDPAKLFESPVKSVWLEVGFGSSEHLFNQSLANPEVGFIGCEPFVNGVAKLCQKIDTENNTNIRIFMDDARLLFSALNMQSVNRLFILFPDPWPKKRHYKRRIINSETIPLMHKFLVQGGELRIASDEPSYIHWILMHMSQEQGFIWSAKSREDWRNRKEDWPQTRYEKKALQAGRTPIFLTYKTK
tara:strand:+ start:5 stop:688 length:684 start_codon:yes stop_codon:yes gene_type:complete